jgi:hypothetical protein
VTEQFPGNLKKSLLRAIIVFALNIQSLLVTVAFGEAAFLTVGRGKML